MSTRVTRIETSTTDDVLLPSLFVAGERDVDEPAPSALRRLLVCVDATGVLLGWGIGLLATGAIDLRSGSTSLGRAAVVVLTAASMIAAVASQKLYLARICTVRAIEIQRLCRAAGIATVAALLVPRALPVEIDVDGALLGGTLSLLFLVFGRGVYRTWLQSRRRDGRFTRSVVLIGSNDEADELARLVADHPELGYRIIGFVGPADELADQPEVRKLGEVSQALEIVERTQAGGVIIAASALHDRERNALVRWLLQAGIHVQLTSGVWGIDHRRLLVQPLAYEPLFYIEATRLAWWHVVVKRVIDISVAVVAGVVTAPVLAAAAVAVKLHDRGPVIFKQQRVGRNGVPFTMYKLRTMVPNAEKLALDLTDRVARDGPSFKVADDPRRTSIGRFLERTSIDELPQVLNVIRGEMSIVGPRPALLGDAVLFDDELRTRDMVRPGITGLWQIEARDNPRFSAYRRYDLFYLENWSVILDLAIMLATVQRVVWRSFELIAGRRAEMAAAKPPPPVVVN